MFFFGQSSQGAQAPAYPYPMYDVLTGIKADKTYKMVYLENEYLRIGILPEIGGRIFEGLDKTDNYNFVYRQHVIKPVLISILGAWISGGIRVEHTAPPSCHHLRAGAVHRVEDNADGSKTVWVGELEFGNGCAGRWVTRSAQASPSLEAKIADSQSCAGSQHPCSASPTWPFM